MQQDSNAAASPGLISVGNYPDTLSAESVRSCLEMEGVAAYVFDGEISSMQGWYTNAFGGVKVMVAKSDKSRAQAILAGSDLVDPDLMVLPQDEISPDSIHCPYCHSPRLRTRETWGLPKDPVQRLLARLFHKTLVTNCPDCGSTKRT